jgi:hypothetical protein
MARSKSTMLAAVVALAAGAVSCSSPAAAEPAPGCNVLDNLTEKIISVSLNEIGGPYPAVGDSAVYLTRFYDPAGKLVGTVYGKANIPFKNPDGHVMEYSEERIELDGGVVETEGFYDITNGIAGEWQFLPALGTSGGYRDKLGKRSFRILKPNALLNAKIELCPPAKAH